MKEPLEKFGAFFVQHLRDKMICDFEMLLNGAWKAPELQELQRRISGFTDARKEEADSGGAVRVLVDGHEVAKLSDGLHGEIFGAEGWIARFSKYPSEVEIERSKSAKGRIQTMLGKKDDNVACASANPAFAPRFQSTRLVGRVAERKSLAASPALMKMLVLFCTASLLLSSSGCMTSTVIRDSRNPKPHDAAPWANYLLLPITVPADIASSPIQVPAYIAAGRMGFTLYSREVVLSKEHPDDDFLKARLVSVAEDGTTRIQTFASDETLEAPVGGYFVGTNAYGTHGLRLISASHQNGEARFERKWC